MKTYDKIRFRYNLQAGLEYISENWETIVDSVDLLFLIFLDNEYISHLYCQYTIILLVRLVNIGESKSPQFLL